MQHRKSKELRYMLAQVGIKLDDEKPEVVGPKTELREDPDRERTTERIMEILIAAGAPDRDVPWLTASCPSIADAMLYAPPPDGMIGASLAETCAILRGMISIDVGFRP